jgi:hypothetical protein
VSLAGAAHRRDAPGHVRCMSQELPIDHRSGALCRDAGVEEVRTARSAVPPPRRATTAPGQF